MSENFFEQQRAEAEKRRMQLDINTLKSENYGLRRRLGDLERNGEYDDSELWMRLEELERQFAELQAEFERFKLKEA